MTSLKDKCYRVGKFYGGMTLFSMGGIFVTNMVSPFSGYLNTSNDKSAYYIDLRTFMFVTSLKSVCYGLLWPLIPYQIYKNPNLLLTTGSIKETDDNGKATTFTIFSLNLENK